MKPWNENLAPKKRFLGSLTKARGSWLASSWLTCGPWKADGYKYWTETTWLEKTTECVLS